MEALSVGFYEVNPRLESNETTASARVPGFRLSKLKKFCLKDGSGLEWTTSTWAMIKKKAKKLKLRKSPHSERIQRLETVRFPVSAGSTVSPESLHPIRGAVKDQETDCNLSEKVCESTLTIFEDTRQRSKCRLPTLNSELGIDICEEEKPVIEPGHVARLVALLAWHFYPTPRGYVLGSRKGNALLAAVHDVSRSNGEVHLDIIKAGGISDDISEGDTTQILSTLDSVIKPKLEGKSSQVATSLSDSQPLQVSVSGTVEDFRNTTSASIAGQSSDLLRDGGSFLLLDPCSRLPYASEMPVYGISGDEVRDSQDCIASPGLPTQNPSAAKVTKEKQCSPLKDDTIFTQDTSNSLQNSSSGVDALKFTCLSSEQALPFGDVHMNCGKKAYMDLDTDFMFTEARSARNSLNQDSEKGLKSDGEISSENGKLDLLRTERDHVYHKEKETAESQRQRDAETYQRLFSSKASEESPKTVESDSARPLFIIRAAISEQLPGAAISTIPVSALTPDIEQRQQGGKDFSPLPLDDVAVPCIVTNQHETEDWTETPANIAILENVSMETNSPYNPQDYCESKRDNDPIAGSRDLEEDIATNTKGTPPTLPAAPESPAGVIGKRSQDGMLKALQMKPSGGKSENAKSQPLCERRGRSKQEKKLGIERQNRLSTAMAFTEDSSKDTGLDQTSDGLTVKEQSCIREEDAKPVQPTTPQMALAHDKKRHQLEPFDDLKAPAERIEFTDIVKESPPKESELAVEALPVNKERRHAPKSYIPGKKSTSDLLPFENEAPNSIKKDARTDSMPSSAGNDGKGAKPANALESPAEARDETALHKACHAQHTEPNFGKFGKDKRTVFASAASD